MGRIHEQDGPLARCAWCKRGWSLFFRNSACSSAVGFGRDGADFAPAQTERFFHKGAHLGQTTAHAGLLFDGGLGFAGRTRRVLQEVVFQGGLMGAEFVGLPFQGRWRIRSKPPVGELVEIALDAAAGDIGEAGDVRVGEVPGS